MKINVIIGRFQPFHSGHEALLSFGINGCDKLVILVGSANKPRSIKNPWTFAERRAMIREYLTKSGLDALKVQVLPINDYKYSDHAWVSDVIQTIKATHLDTFAKIKLVGHWKRGNTYLRNFPQWGYKEFASPLDLNATDIRYKMMNNGDPMVPQSVMDDFEYFLREERKFSVYPYPETNSFQCADAIITCIGHVLLIKRKFAPGAGNWAFPGGFKNAKETFLDCAIRETYEETNIRVPERIFATSLVATRLFDAPDRGSGIPRITVAHHFHLEPEADGSLPRANGRDDAMECKWVSIGSAMNDYDLHDDHGDILQVMTSSSAVPAFQNRRILSV